MRSFGTSSSMGRDSRRGLWLALKLSAVALGIGLVMSAGPVRAGDDDDDDDMTFEEKLIDNLMSGLGAKGMEKKGIEYRERSPLVVPPSLDLPPPSSEAKNAPNWPKDPDEKRRQEAIALRKKAGNRSPQQQYLKDIQPLSPAELNAHKTGPQQATNQPPPPGSNINNPTMSPAELGYTGGLLGMFKGSKPESKPFTSEPPRESLVEPPPGYQTPSPNYVYGSGEDTTRKTYFDVQSGKEKVQ
ncbi:hypothetical protein [Bradyrhizobium guangzhouense]|uniref:Uncharacterized protein n=1 Tax=Bradyrhizobium guangzhouense TaxID=1325095 RepID=A0AAE5X5P0_9BRAD|nr:hypothetical protein [Bradyrhizobium guangzhouense]QAU49200.1 hypothetical protein XH91_30130 [Bradyrhizobium guangzhouense]RXH15693.1 hypothetical protein EAS54_18290 [Bradyrhizobium guangzhouense]RXH15897.1 hypothetical protein EAS56_07700 [Bradyrhizobium guangzhouense]